MELLLKNQPVKQINNNYEKYNFSGRVYDCIMQ